LGPRRERKTRHRWQAAPGEERKTMLDITGRPSAASAELIGHADLLGHKPKCDQCGEPFEPRSGKGGKPQRFCSQECRRAFHTEPQRAPTPPAPVAENSPAVPEPPEPKAAPAASAEDSEDFDWSDDEDIVLREQQSIAIYRNKFHGIVIRQARRWNEEDDTVIVINRENIDAFLDRLTNIAGVASFP
jgi:hypothetical protein